MTDQFTDEPNWDCYDPLPHNHWRKQAYHFWKNCKSDLWDASSMARSARCFFEDLGFDEETVRKAEIGLNKEDQYGSRNQWGLPTGPGMRSGPIWLPRGIVFPWADNKGLSRLYIRRLRNDVGLESDRLRKEKGHHVPVCISPLYNAQSVDPGMPVVLVEREFDALAIRDEASDLCSPVATGSPSGARRIEWWRLLSEAPAVLVAFDRSETGEEAAAAWMNALPNAHRREACSGRDDRMTPGPRLRGWVQDGLASISPKL